MEDKRLASLAKTLTPQSLEKQSKLFLEIKTFVEKDSSPKSFRILKESKIPKTIKNVSPIQTSKTKLVSVSPKSLTKSEQSNQKTKNPTQKDSISEKNWLDRRKES